MSELTKWQKSQYKKEVNELKESFDKLIEETKNNIQRIEEFKKELLDWSESEESTKVLIDNAKIAIDKLQETAEEKFNEISQYYSTIFDWDTENESLKQELESITKDFKESLWAIQKQETEINTFYLKIFWQRNSEWKIEAWLQKEIDAKLAQINKVQETQTQNYKALFERIENLLPSATSAWLAHAYREQKESYKTPITTWNVVFIFTIIIMVVWGVWSVMDITTHGFLKPKDFNDAITTLLWKLPFLVPLIWLAWFASKKQAQNKRLQEEYAHREVMSKSFIWYKREIEKLDPKDSKWIATSLIKNIVDTINKNPSEVLDWIHSDKSPWEWLIQIHKHYTTKSEKPTNKNQEE